MLISCKRPVITYGPLSSRGALDAGGAAYSAAYVGYRAVSRFGVDERPVMEIWPPHRSMRKGKITSESSILRHAHDAGGLRGPGEEA
jgi:hypothetical protein